MSGRGVLFANIGAEEGAAAATAPFRRAVAGLWQLLFRSDAGWLGEDRPPEPWPEAWGARPEAAVFPWLADAGASWAWLNSAEAERAVAAAGGVLAGAAPEVVQRVHDKAFAHAAALEAGLQPPEIADTVVVLDPAALADPDAAVRAIETALARWPAPLRRSFTLKPRLGSSGRGRVAGRDGRADCAAVRGALSRLARQGGAMLEPWLERSADLSALLAVGAAGDVTLLGTTRQCLAPSGRYLGNRGTIDSRGRVTSGDDRDEALREAAGILAARAAAAGYVGPCGLDAFRFRRGDGEGFRPAVELNARFTLGHVAIALVRRGLAALVADQRLRPGDRAAFHFGLDAPAGGWPELPPACQLHPLWRPGESLRPALVVAPDLAALDDLLGPGGG
ncbi:MAG: hypothetical protein ACE5FL_12050 [Myxococcota bacterium]